MEFYLDFFEFFNKNQSQRRGASPHTRPRRTARPILLAIVFTSSQDAPSEVTCISYLSHTPIKIA